MALKAGERFGSREICNVTFKSIGTTRIGQKTLSDKQLAFKIDTATASTMEQTTSVVYARGGIGNPKLIAWEGEKDVTFSVTDALISPQGFAMLTGAGVAADSATKHKHMNMEIAIDATSGNGTITLAQLQNETGLTDTSFKICNEPTFKPQAVILDTEKNLVDSVEVSFGDTTAGFVTADGTTPITVATTGDTAKGKTILVDFYIILTTQAQEVTIGASDFGGYFYVEAETVYRLTSGKDVKADIVFPKVKIQSAFTLSMSPTGDPASFEFKMDAFPAYTYFNKTKQIICDIVIAGEGLSTESTADHVAHPAG